MTRREKGLLLVLGLLVVLAASVVGVTIFESEVASRQQAISRLRTQKQAFLERISLTFEQAELVVQFVARFGDTLATEASSAEQRAIQDGDQLPTTFSNLLKSQGLEVQNFRVSRGEGAIHFEARGDVARILSGLRASEDGNLDIFFQNLQLVRLRENDFSWRGTIQSADAIAPGDATASAADGDPAVIVQRVEALLFDGRSLGDRQVPLPGELARFFRRPLTVQPTGSVAEIEHSAARPAPAVFEGFEFIGVVNRNGVRVFSFRDRERNAVFSIQVGGTWFDWILVGASEAGFVFERQGVSYRVQS